MLSKTANRARQATHHLTTLLLVAWGIYAYRDLWPLATLTLSPKDAAEGSILWARVVILSVVAAVVPLCIPHEYIPVDLKVCFIYRSVPKRLHANTKVESASSP